MTDTPKPDILEKLGVQGLPDKNFCDKYGNLLVYEKNRKIWSIVSFQHYLDFAICYEKWAYLPEEPEPELKAEYTSEDLMFLGRIGKLFMAGVYRADTLLKRHLKTFEPTVQRKLLDEFEESEHGIDLEWVMKWITKNK